MAPEFGHLFDHLPLIPEAVMRKHHVHQSFDTRFRAAARLLQSLWRSDRQLPAGTYIRANGKPQKLGSRISLAAGRAGENFLTPDIAALVNREVCYREIGAMIDEERLFTNLLSSMPLVFNLFGPLRLDLKLATAVMSRLFPSFNGTVTQVLFEHAPSRSNPAFTDDRTAFDAVIRYTTDAGRRGFIAFEVKYSEACTEPVPPPKPRYVDLSRQTGLFLDPDGPQLRTNPLQQLWREHCLAQTMVQNGLYDEGSLVLVAPRLNHLVQNAAAAYGCQLTEPGEGKVGFMNLHLETFIDALRTAGAAEHAGKLHRRYCDFWLVDGEIELSLAGLASARAKKAGKTGTTMTAKTAADAPRARKRTPRRRSAIAPAVA